MKIELRELSLNDGSDILEMIREIGPGENGFMNDEYNMDVSEYKYYLLQNMDMSKGIGLQPQWVPQTKYWLMIDDHPVGIGKLRSYLTVNTRKIGGHIGYCIRPSERGKGYGNIILAEVLKKAKLKSVPRALVTCKESNTPSRKIIEYNGGKLDRIVNGELCHWIELGIGTGIRELHIDDYNEIYDLWSKTPGMDLSFSDTEENIKKFLLKNVNLSFCYTVDNKVVGTILCGHDGRRGYVYHVAVIEEYRGRGFGKTMVDKSLQRLKDEGINKCHLFIYGDNELGGVFWKSTGWSKEEDIYVHSRNF